MLSLQAGARKVYAVEASGMAEFARQLAERNSNIGKAVQVGRITKCATHELGVAAMVNSVLNTNPGVAVDLCSAELQAACTNLHSFNRLDSQWSL
jgi:hypothetical protein